MDAILQLLQSQEIKKRLNGISHLSELTQTDDINAKDSIKRCLEQVILCLRDHNAKLNITSLEIITFLLQPKYLKDDQTIASLLRSNHKILWTNVFERLGDNKLQVREKASAVIVMLSEIFGLDMVLERLQICYVHKNWRTREQSLHCVWKLVERFEAYEAYKSVVLDKTIHGLEDSVKDVREAAMLVLEKIYAHFGPCIMDHLHDRKVRSAHLKELSERFDRIIRSNANKSFRKAEEKKISRFEELLLSSQYSNSSSPQKQTEQTRLFETKPTPIKDIAPEIYTERELSKELDKIEANMSSEDEWSLRASAMKKLQEVLTNIKHHPSHISLVSRRLKHFRGRLCAQVGDLRSVVSREACRTIELLPETLGDEFNSHAETFISSLLKATYVTIQVISTSADKCIRQIIKSANSGCARTLVKFVEAIRSKSQILRLNSACYLTLILQHWDPSFLSRHINQYLGLLPSILQDADSEVRAQARKCYWAFHQVFEQEAKACLQRLDPSVQKNVQEEYLKVSLEKSGESSHARIAPLIAMQNGYKPVLGKRSQDKLFFRAEEPLEAWSYRNEKVGSVPQAAAASNQQEGGSQDTASLFGARRILGTPLSMSLTQDSGYRSSAFSSGAVRVGNAPDILIDTKKKDDIVPSVCSLRVAKGEKPTDVIDPNRAVIWKPERVLMSKILSPEKTMNEKTRITNAKHGPKRRVVSAENTDANIAADNINPSRTTAPVRTEDPEPNKHQSRNHWNAFFQEINHERWSNRLAALQSLDALLKDPKKSAFAKSNERVLCAVIKALADSHYRVAQFALEQLMIVLEKCSVTEYLQKHLRVMLPRLFQKSVDTKEIIRRHASKTLDFMALNVDTSTLIGFVFPLVTEGNNVKVKVSVCHYVRRLLPKGEQFFRDTKDAHDNSKLIRSLLTKIAQGLELEAPFSLSSAWTDLLLGIRELYAVQIDQAASLLAPSQRQTLGRLFYSRGVQLGSTNTASSSHSSNPNGKPKETLIKDMDTSVVKVPEKHPCDSVKEMKENQIPQSTSPTLDRKSSVKLEIRTSEQCEKEFESRLASLRERKDDENAQRRGLHEIVRTMQAATPEFWIQNRNKTVLVLLELVRQCKGRYQISLLKALQKCLARHLEDLAPLFSDVMNSVLDCARSNQQLVSFLTRACLEEIVAHKNYSIPALNMLLSSMEHEKESSVLVTFLHLTSTALAGCGDKEGLALVQENLMVILLQKLYHECANVRKIVVDCIVTLFYASNEDDAIIAYISDRVDAIKLKLITVYINDRKRREALQDYRNKTVSVLNHSKDPVQKTPLYL